MCQYPIISVQHAAVCVYDIPFIKEIAYTENMLIYPFIYFSPKKTVASRASSLPVGSMFPARVLNNPPPIGRQAQGGM